MKELLEKFWVKSLIVCGAVVAGIGALVVAAHLLFGYGIPIEEKNANIEGEDYRFRIIVDHHHKNAHKYELYMPQMLLGGVWEDMDDTWHPVKGDAREVIEQEIEKEQSRKKPRYAVVETIDP